MFVVTGVTSNTGGAVVDALFKQGAPVRVVGRNHERLRPYTDRGAEAIVAEPSDSAALAKAFDGADAVYVMLQPGNIPESHDFLAYQRASIAAIITALTETHVSRVVGLSGWGANYEQASGPLEGLRILEARLREIVGLNTVVLRPGWFMENAGGFIADLAKTGAASGQLRGDLKLPMIATADIGVVAADALLNGQLDGFSVHEVEGPEYLSLNEAAAIVGTLTRQPDARYVQISPEDARAQFLTWAFSEHMADAFVQMTQDLNGERIRMLQPADARITTATRFQTFAKSILEKIAAVQGADL